MNYEDKSISPLLLDEKRFQLLVEGVTDYAIYMLDTQGKIVSWNSGAKKLKGYSEKEVVGKHFSIFYSLVDQAAGIPKKALQIALSEGKFEAEGWRIKKDGSRFWASVVIDPLRDQSGKHIGFAKITRDVTDRKQAQDALLESERRFRYLVQGVTDYAIYMLSPTGEITNWNTGAERIKGYKEHEIVGKHFSIFYTDEDREKGVPEYALATARKEGRFEQESWRKRKDGTRFWAHIVLDAIRDSNGDLLGFAKITRDITERKNAAEALEKANAALFQAQKMEAIGQLTGGIAHDFNNLLAVLASGLDVLSMHKQNPGEIKMLENMQRAIERGANLTQQLLTFARQQQLKVEKYNINKLINSFESVLRRAGNSTIEFEVKLSSKVNSVLLDAARFEAALLNLVVNARDAMPEGGKLSIVAENVQLRDGEVGKLPAGDYAKVSVIDTGTGIPPEIVDRVFEPFFTTKEIGKGTGLGLSQVYGFITQSGGEITVQSEVGKGTTISLYLPIESNEDHKLIEDEPNAETVLIVEDEPDVLEVASQLFQSIGYDVLTASNGKDAIDILRRKTDINVLFTDVMMPNGMSGIDLARKVRELNPHTKIILASGYPLPALKAQHGSLDEFIFMNKPYRLSELAKKLRMAA